MASKPKNDTDGVKRKQSEAALGASGPQLADYWFDADSDLAGWKADDRAFRGDDKDAALDRLNVLGKRLEALQNVFYADQRFKLLLVLQGMDTSGKDGTIKAVFQPLDPLGIRVASFKAPTPEERARDYLWRIHAQVPRNGEIVIFNRSHYEDVLVPWVHRTIDDEARDRRLVQICDFERMLVQNGTVIVKCFLHLSRAEQKRRLQARLADPIKQWKFDPTDLVERKAWLRYQRAYAAVLAKTSTEHAKWLVVPADSKTNRNLMVSHALVACLEALDLRFPAPSPALEKLKVR